MDAFQRFIILQTFVGGFNSLKNDFECFKKFNDQEKKNLIPIILLYFILCCNYQKFGSQEPQ